jgi:hypothetical protein
MVIVSSTETEANVQEIRGKLALKDDERLQLCADFDVHSSKHVIFSLFDEYVKEVKKGEPSTME